MGHCENHIRLTFPSQVFTTSLMSGDRWELQRYGNTKYNIVANLSEAAAREVLTRNVTRIYQCYALGGSRTGSNSGWNLNDLRS